MGQFRPTDPDYRILKTQPHLIGRRDPEPRDKADRHGPNQRIDPRRCVC